MLFFVILFLILFNILLVSALCFFNIYLILLTKNLIKEVEEIV